MSVKQEMTSDVELSDSDEDNAITATPRKRKGKKQRKIQFRWNPSRDLALLKEVEEIKPFLVDKHGQKTKGWINVAVNINKVYNGDIERRAAQERFERLLRFNKSDLKSRYKTELHLVPEVKEKLDLLERLMIEKLKCDTKMNGGMSTDDEDYYEVGSSRSSRKKQFRWNPPRDIKLLKEIEIIKPFSAYPMSKKRECWNLVAQFINEEYAGAFDRVNHVGVKSRFRRLLLNYKQPDFKDRYWCDYDLVPEVQQRLGLLEKMREEAEVQRKSGTHVEKTEKSVGAETEEAGPRRRIRCSVPTCTNEYLGQFVPKVGRRYFPLPTNLARRQEWLTAIGVEEKHIPCLQRFRVCTDHFHEDDMTPGFPMDLYQRMPRLSNTAVPSLKLPCVTSPSVLLDGFSDTEVVDGQFGQEDVINDFRNETNNDNTSSYSPPPSKKLRPDQDGDPLSNEADNETNEPSTETTGIQEPCLICSKKDTRRKIEIYNFPGSNGFSPLNQQLWCYFVLQKLLKLPKSVYKNMLGKNGASMNPSEWFVTCRECLHSINTILKMTEEIRTLELKVRNLKESILQKCIEDVNRDQGNGLAEHFAGLDILNEIRSSVKEMYPKPESKIFKAEHEAEDSNIYDDMEEDAEGGFGVQNKKQRDQLNKDSDDEWLPPHDSPTSDIEESNSPIQPDPLEMDDIHEETKSDDDDVKSAVSRKRTNTSVKNVQNQRTASTMNLRGAFPCKICPRKYNIRNKYTRHMNLHAKTKRLFDGNFDCFKCKAPYDSEKSLRLHLRTEHCMRLHHSWDPLESQEKYVYTLKTKKEVLAKLEGPSKELLCEICTRVYTKQFAFEKHMEDHKLSKELHEGRFDCCKCKAPYVNVVGLRKHLLNRHAVVLDEKWDGDPSSTQESHITTYVSGNPTTIAKHEPKKRRKKTDAKTTYECSRCNTTYINEKALEQHSKAHADTPDNLHCSQCHRPYPSEEALQKHMQKVHNVRDYKCELCGLDVETKWRFDAHMINHKLFDGSVDKSISTTHFVCNICKKLFQSRRLLSGHKLSFHADELDIRVFKCQEPECTKAYKHMARLRDHINMTHKNQRRFQCEECGFAALTNDQLSHHSQKHRSIPHVCEHCSATFVYYGGLRGHMQRYHPEKYEPTRKNPFSGVAVDRLENELGERHRQQQQFPCKYCDSVFPFKPDLKYHLKFGHQDMYSFKCDQCERVYLSEQSLKLHKKINHKEGAQVTCGYCHKVFSHRIKLYDHRKSCKARPDDPNAPKILVLEDVTSAKRQDASDDSEDGM